MKNYTNKDEKDQSKKIIILIVIIIILLLLITSCSCTSQFLGKIGASLSDSINNLFRNEDDYPIKDGTDDIETIKNQELKFDTSRLEVSLSDNNVKLSYTYKKIHPKEFTCSTSDASIATCYVKDGYVVINPKAVGTVKVTLETTVNGKKYVATATVIVTDSTRSIELSSSGGIIDLSQTNQATVTYRLIGLEGEVTVVSSNNSIATAAASNGTLFITASKPGNVTITLSIIHNGKEYTATYNLSVVENLSNNNNNNGSGNNSGSNSGSNNSGGGNSSGGNQGGNPSNPGGDNNLGGDNKPGGGDDNNPDDNEDDIKYVVTTPEKKYSMSFINSHGERYIILNTNLFTNQNVEVIPNENNKKLLICSNNKDFCITLTVDGEQDTGNIEIEYTGELEEPSSLPFKITANSIGKSIIHVSGGALGKTIAEFDIEINVVGKHIVSLDANGGMFNEFTTLYEFEVSLDDKINLSEYDKPYKINKDDCVYYKFIGYSNTPDGQVIYAENAILENIDSDLILYAIYDTNPRPITELTLEKTLWVTDIPLFHNEEYYNKYKQDKVIYPGAFGSYTMNLKNESVYNIVINGTTLKEDTICVVQGCLNMGYMIKYSTPETPWKASYGKMASNDMPAEYWVFNTNPGTIQLPDVTNSFKAEIPFKDNEKIELKPNDEMQIVIFWKWVDNDKLDTLIGNEAAKKLEDESINDTYGLSVGINFETKIESCTN